jgi:hypothetical protein
MALPMLPLVVLLLLSQRVNIRIATGSESQPILNKSAVLNDDEL